MISSDSASKKILVVLVGPTASGKTDISIRLAQEFGASIISADSRQFYQEMIIGTAAPNPEERAAAPHFFVQHISIHDKYDVWTYEKEAIAKINALHKHSDIVVLTGGSGLYIDAICNGLDDLPDTEAEIRCMLKQEFDEKGIEFLREKLRQADPEYFAKVDIHNPGRMMRALEVCISTGKPFSSFHSGKKKERPFQILYFGISWPREKLVERIHLRVEKMLECGLETEAKQLFGLRHLNALNTVGYRELFDHFSGKISFEAAIENIRTNTRRYAKRQMTWFRRNEAIRWFGYDEFEKMKGEVYGFPDSACRNR
ncbi:MAG: tRNA (adenosine(37)-N6)-dimethylallyltransferase MiaA [Bacteroidetes bacterium]|nr:tRNA (adenosine(37)-N6)-dimethylallyltransferase MiaA [Bacteroidota bacterium]MBU1720026.1 tRNA (adenosine(37)-N6)-dimethylallyltransferase MiaA [Bacteroidota bacterium]